MEVVNSRSKTRLDTLFVAHAAFSVGLGALAAVFPHFVEFFLVSHEGERLALVDHEGGNEQKITHLVLRLYGVLVLGQGWIVWQARGIEDGQVRRALVQAYCGCFALTSIALLRAQLTEGGGLNAAWNWVNITAFALLAAFYGWFVWGEPIHVFEGLGKTNA